MFKPFVNIWKTESVRKRILFDILILLIFRLGCALPVPFINSEAIAQAFNSGNLFSYLNMMSGGALSNGTFFALGVQPYINASIVLQLLCVAFPALKDIQKDDKKRFQKIMQGLTIGLSVLIGTGYYALLRRYSALTSTGFFVAVVLVAVFTAGAQMSQWLAWQIDDNGVGSGMSIMILAGILARWSNIFAQAGTLGVYKQLGLIKPIIFLCLAPVLYVAGMFFVVHTDKAEKRVPVNYAKRVVGRKQYGGASSYIPIKVIMSGVLPVIFAGTVLSLPPTIGSFISAEKHPALANALTSFDNKSWLYCLFYVILIFLFNYFYISIQFDPVEISNNLRQNGGVVPGIRPGRPTSDYLLRQTNSVAFLGALILAVIAATPIIYGNLTGLGVQMSGTSLLITSGVILEIVASVDSYLNARHHKGFLD